MVELAGDFDSNQLTILLLSPFKCMIKQTKLSPSLKTKTIETCQSQTDRQRITGKQLNLLNVDVFMLFEFIQTHKFRLYCSYELLYSLTLESVILLGLQE